MKSIVKWPLIAGSILFILGSLVGVGGTILGMVLTFNTLSSSGVSSSEPVAAGVSSSLITTVIGIPLGFLGLGLLLFSLAAFLITRNRNSSNKTVNATA